MPVAFLYGTAARKGDFPGNRVIECAAESVDVACWSSCDPVQSVSAIEADRYGARLMLPWNVQAGETIIVSIADQVGQYHTQKARVAWTEKLRLGGKVICGVEFAEELQLAC